ncbi:MAG: serine/threonine-protein kinase [Planctomycetota bacterium]
MTTKKKTIGPGESVADHEILRRVGEGARGVVFQAKNAEGRLRALKILRPEFAKDDTAVGEFREEARATAAVQHESVVSMYECGVDHGVHYISMEFVDGPPLDRLLAERKGLSWKTAVRVAIQAADALGHAHDIGYLHRDIKPGNILLYSDGTARVTDFGIVKDIRTLRGFLVNGKKVGTAAYASPEQCTGKRLGPATDLYSLGATLYHMVCGRPPFVAENRKMLLAKHVRTQPVPPSRLVKNLPRPLSNALERSLAKSPMARFPSMDNFAATLRMILEGRVAIVPS